MQISRQVRSSAVFLMILALVFFAVLPVSQAINLGEEAKAEEIVQIKIWDKPDGTAHKCTGTAISEQWVLTAAHCVEGEKYTDPNVPANVVKVHFSNSKTNPGPAYSIESYQIAPFADMALLRLSKPHKLSKYGVLANSHQFKDGEMVTLYGYGKGLRDLEVKTLRSAQLKIVGQNYSYNAGETLKMVGVTGASNHGDSGGPIVNAAGEIIGVNVIGSHAAWYDPYSPSEAVDLSHYRQWVKDVAGI